MAATAKGKSGVAVHIGPISLMMRLTIPRAGRTPWYLPVGRSDYSSWHVCIVGANCAGGAAAGHCRRWHCRCKRRCRRDVARRSRRPERDQFSALPGGHHKRGASLRAEKRCCPPYGDHKPLHGPTRPRNRQPHHQRDWPDVHRYARFSLSGSGHRPLTRPG